MKKGISLDAISTQLIDFYAQIWKSQDFIHEHQNDLYSPYTYVGDNLGVKQASGEEIFAEIMSKTNFEMLLGKTNPKHVFIFKIAELINSYIESSLIDNPQSSSTKTVKSFIEDMFDNQFFGTYPEFKTRIDEIAKEVFGNKIKSITEQGSSFYKALKKVFTDNINNLLKIAPIMREDSNTGKLVSGTSFKLSLGGFVTTLFESDESGSKKIASRDLLPSNAKFIKSITGGKAVLADLTEVKWIELRDKGTLFVAHDKNKNFIVVEREMEKKLPSNIIEGYYHTPYDQNKEKAYKDKVFNNVMLNINDKLLFGQVSFKGSGEIEILSEDWYKAYFNPNHISVTSKPSKLNSLLTNAPGSTADIFTAKYITVIGIVSGSNYVSVMQRAKTNLYPTAPHNPYTPWIKSREGSSKETL